MPFRTANGLILLDVKVNGRAAVLLLDTGSNITLFRGLEHANDYITIEVGPGEQWGIMAANMKRLKTPDTEAYKGVRQLDGILGENFLQQFSSVCIDYKASVIEFGK